MVISKKPMSIDEMADKFNLSRRKLLQMQKAGVFSVELPESDPAIKMRYLLRKGSHLSVQHCLQLIWGAVSFKNLNEYQGKAKKQIAALGHITPENCLPADECFMIDSAAGNDPIGIAKFAQWISDTIPNQGCGYHYIAVRALRNCPAIHWNNLYHKIGKAILIARQHEILANQSGSDGKSMTFSAKKCLTFDL